MHFDPSIVRAVAIALFLVFLFGSRLVKGSAVETPEGPVFRIKPIFAWLRAIVVPAYIAYFVYSTVVEKHPMTWLVALLLVAVIAIVIMQMPGTITLTPTAITQSFWFQPSKAIQYNEVMVIQSMQGGRMIRVLGDNRVKITHTSNHCAAAEFQKELERRTGKKLTT